MENEQKVGLSAGDRLARELDVDSAVNRKVDEAVAYFKKEQERIATGAGWLSRNDPDEFERRQAAYERWEMSAYDRWLDNEENRATGN